MHFPTLTSTIKTFKKKLSYTTLNPHYKYELHKSMQNTTGNKKNQMVITMKNWDKAINIHNNRKKHNLFTITSTEQ